jgi:hypothetical protein
MLYQQCQFPSNISMHNKRNKNISYFVWLGLGQSLTLSFLSTPPNQLFLDNSVNYDHKRENSAGNIELLCELTQSFDIVSPYHIVFLGNIFSFYISDITLHIGFFAVFDTNSIPVGCKPRKMFRPEIRSNVIVYNQNLLLKGFMNFMLTSLFPL